MPTTSPHLPSRVLGRYAMYEQFAAGGMATLHFGRLLGPAGFSRTVAIKRLHAHLSEDPDFVAMFLDEARLAARIHHPNVIQTLDVESSEGELFVVLDYVHGDSLSRLMRDAKRLSLPLTPELVCTILFGALEGLHSAHEARDAQGDPLDLVHRDVSPHNVLVGTDGIPRVLDFGVAKARGRAQTTRVGQLKGKLAYMAPEQLQGRVTRRSDVFSASVVLWEALTGSRLFQGEDEGEVVDKLLHRPIPSPRERMPSLTRGLEDVVMRGLERDPDKRYPSARDMALALEGKTTLATAIEVGAWVERVAATTLAQRAERVKTIEAETTRDDAGRSGRASKTPLAPPRAAAASLTGATSPTVAVPGLARVEERADAGPGESTRTGVVTVTDASVPRRRSRVVSLASLGVASLLVAFVVILRTGSHAPSGTSATAPADSTVPSSVAPAPDVPALETAAAPIVEPTDRAATPDPPPVRHAPAAAVPVRRHAACSPPYTIDARGVRHYKPECL